MFERIKAFIRSKRAEKALRGGGGGGHHHHHGHHGHHGGGGGWGRRGWGGGWNQGYYTQPLVIAVQTPEIIVVDSQSNMVLPTGVKVNRVNGSWVQIASAYVDRGQMVISGATGKKFGQQPFQVRVPIVDRPTSFPNNRVAFLP